MSQMDEIKKAVMDNSDLFTKGIVKCIETLGLVESDYEASKTYYLKARRGKKLIIAVKWEDE